MPWIKSAVLPEKSPLWRSLKARTSMRLRSGSSGPHWTAFSGSKPSFWFFTWRHFYYNCCLCYVPNSPSPQNFGPKCLLLSLRFEPAAPLPSGPTADSFCVQLWREKLFPADRERGICDIDTKIHRNFSWKWSVSFCFEEVHEFFHSQFPYILENYFWTISVSRKILTKFGFGEFSESDVNWKRAFENDFYWTR